MEKVDCELSISVDIDCPNEGCGNSFDLFDIERFTDEGYIHREVLGSKAFGCPDFDEEVACPECKTKFKVGAINW